MSARRADAGVALLEMLIALMIMAMLAVMTAAAFGTFGRVLNGVGRTDDRVEWALSQRQVQIWAQDRPSGLDQGTALALAGNNSRVEFQTIDQSGRYWPGALIAVRVGVKEAALIARVTGQRDASTNPQSNEMVLDEGPISSLSITYFGKHQLGSAPYWAREWRAAPRIPDLIKIEWKGLHGAAVPLILEPGLTEHQAFRSLSSLSPPG